MFAHSYFPQRYFAGRYFPPVVSAEVVADTHDGDGDAKAPQSQRKFTEAELFIIPVDEPPIFPELTSRGRAVVKAVIAEAGGNPALLEVQAIATAINRPDDIASQADVARLVVLGELLDLLSFEFELRVMRLEQDEKDMAAMLALGII